MRRRAIKRLTLLAALLTGALIGLTAPISPFSGVADDIAAAIRFSISGPSTLPQDRVLVLLLDQRSLQTPPLDEIPRVLMSPIWAQLTETALSHGADRIGFDLVMAFDANRLQVGEQRPLRRYDVPFLDLLDAHGPEGRMVVGRTKRLAPAARFEMIAGARGVAYLNVDVDRDGIARRVQTSLADPNGGAVPTLTGALLGAETHNEIRITPPAPLTSLRTASVIDVLRCGDDAALQTLFMNKVVVVGGALPGEDVIRTPDRFMRRSPDSRASDKPTIADAPCAFPAPTTATEHGDIPGVFVHAAAIDAVASGWRLQTAPKWQAALLAACMAFCAAACALTLTRWPALGASLVLMSCGLLGAAWAQAAGVLVPAAEMALAAMLGALIGAFGRHVSTDRRAKALKASFGRYVAPELVDRILAQERLPDLDGENRHIAVMFADLSGFTALSEALKDDKKLTATVNHYLGIVAREVERSGGYVDKYIGDAVMAIWNAPADHSDHERAAVGAAIRIHAEVEAAAADHRSRGLPNFAIRVGLNSGYATVGNVGAERRLNYTAVGDTVNIAARFESLPTYFGTPIVVGESLARAASERCVMLEIASIQVKGRREPVAVYAPLQEAADALTERYAEALAAYRARRFDRATEIWRRLAGADWPGAPIAAAMAAFSEEARREALLDDWSGQVVLRTK